METRKILLTVLVMLMASALIAGTSLLAKALGTAGRYIFALAALLLATAILRPRFTKPAIWLHFGRASAGSFGVTCMFAASALIRPGFDSFHPASLIALLAAAILAIEIIFVKLLSGREGMIQILLFSNGFGTLFAGSIALFFWIAPTPQQWLGLVAIGMLMVSAQALFLFAIRRGDASFVAPLFYMTLIFAALYDFLIFDVLPSPLSQLGAGIIIAGALLIAWSEKRRAPKGL